jgi:uroporphyrin-III C-methyltransferase
MPALPESTGAAPAVPPSASPAAHGAPAPVAGPGRWIATGAAVLAAVAAAALVMAWNTQQRVKAFESELVKRQQDSGAQAAEARLLAGQAQEGARDAAGKVALLEARVAESSIQRTQLEDLIQSLARSRDENVLADLEAAVRVALQQSAITGSAEPLITTLKQADERLARYGQPRLERVRRAVAQDLERARAAGAIDLPLLSIRLDEVIRQVDELPLLAAVDRRPPARPAGRSKPAPVAASGAVAASAAASGPETWSQALTSRWRGAVDQIWDEARALVRVTRIDMPEAMLVAPEQAFFLRENLKLRLLNARLAMLSRQFDIAQSDLRDAQSALERYFDRTSRRVTGALDGVRQISAQARTVTVPRPDATLAAIAAAGR